MTDEIICDKCGSHRVGEVLIDQPKPPNLKPKSMSEYASDPPSRYQSQTFNAVMIYHTYKLRCYNCGHESEEYTR